MSKPIIDLRIKRIEKEIPPISAKVADALALLKANDPAVLPLIEAQLALEALYLLTGEDEGA